MNETSHGINQELVFTPTVAEAFIMAAGDPSEAIVDQFPSTPNRHRHAPLKCASLGQINTVTTMAVPRISLYLLPVGGCISHFFGEWNKIHIYSMSTQTDRNPPFIRHYFQNVCCD